MIEATCMDHLSSNNHSDHMDFSDSSTTGASPPSDFPELPELLPFSASSSYHMGADGSVLLSPVSSVASPPMQHVVTQYAIFPDTPLTHLPSPPNSGKMFYPHWNTHFGFEQGPGPNDDVTIPPEFYMQERCTPDPESYLGGFALADTQSQPVLNQPAPYFVPVPQLGSNGPPMCHSSPVQSVDSPRTLDTSSEVSTPGAESKADVASSTGVCRKRSASTSLETKEEEDDDSDMQEDTDSPDEAYLSSRRNSSAGVRKARKRAPPKKSGATRAPPPIDVEEHKNCFGDLVAPQLKENCPAEERCIFLSRWEHRDKKGQDMWDSIQEDYYKEFEKEQCKETLQMKLTRGRSKYIQWLEKDEEILLQAWQNMERNRYKTLLEEFYKVGGSRNMLLNPGDVEVKAVVDLALEEEIYVEGVNEIELRRRCRFLTGKRRAGARGGDEAGITYNGASLFGRKVDEDDIIDQVVMKQKGGAQRKTVAQRRKRSDAKPSKGPKKIKVEKC